MSHVHQSRGGANHRGAGGRNKISNTRAMEPQPKRVKTEDGLNSETHGEESGEATQTPEIKKALVLEASKFDNRR